MSSFQVSFGENAPCGKSLDDVLNYSVVEIKTRFFEWTDRISKDPLSFGDVEQEILKFFTFLAGLLTIAVISYVPVVGSVTTEAKKIRLDVGKPLRYVRMACLQVTLLCGLTVRCRTSYWLPKRVIGPGRRRGIGKRGEEGVGFYPELSALGIREGVSEALRVEVARTVILLPSFEVAKQELLQRGVDLDTKKVHRVCVELGEDALSARTAEVQKWRRGELVPSTQLEEQKVVVTVDGGRVRVRELKKGRRTKGRRHRFNAPWREPKLLRIYTVDKDGRYDKKGSHVIDCTMKGPDYLMELVAYHLYRLGAQHAEVVLFLGDGAEWIWDRVAKVAQLVGLSEWLAVVDFSHTIGYLIEAIHASYSDHLSRQKLRKLLKESLLKGDVARVLELLNGFPGVETKEEVKAAIRYVKNHAKLMKYGEAQAKRLPIGSGAVESSIRRVINLRAKGAGMFWKIENAEGFLHLRATLLSGEWQLMLRRVAQHTRTTRQVDWEWHPTLYSCKAPENDLDNLIQLVSRKAA